MIEILFLVSILTFVDLGIFGDIIFDVFVKNEFVRSCFQQSVKCKMTVQPREQIMCLVKTQLYDWIRH